MEKFFSEIFLQAIEIFTLVIGIVGVLLSVMLLLVPQSSKIPLRF